MMKKLIFSLVFIMAFVAFGKTQPYNTALGVRLGFFNGITVKHFIKQDRALEGLLSTRWNGFVISGLYEWQNPIKGVQNLDWYIGGGGHIGFWGDRYYYYNKKDPRDNYTIVGIDFIIGLGYTFKEVPFNIALDWKPAFNIIGDAHWWGDGVALSIRYTFH